MTDTPDTEALTEDQAATAMAELLAWHKTTLLEGIAMGIERKWNEMGAGMVTGKVLKTKHNKGYMAALNDIYFSITSLINEETPNGNTAD